MITVLSAFDNVTAAGILARAALAIDDQDNPAGEPRIPEETKLRVALIAELRNKLGVGSDDRSPATLTKLSDLLDQESDSLIGEVDSGSALNRLSEKGQLPSDLFEIRIIPVLQGHYGKKFPQEKKLIEQTVRSPDKEQHFGPPENSNEPSLISLFSKYFPNQYLGRAFTMLVAGQRNGLLLDVHQAWRIYPDLVNLDGVTDLIDMLRRFADNFGTEIEVGGQKGHFILTVDMPKGQHVKISSEVGFTDGAFGNKRTTKQITVTCFHQRNPLGSENQAALVTGIDLDRYLGALKSKGW